MVNKIKTGFLAGVFSLTTLIANAQEDYTFPDYVKNNPNNDYGGQTCINIADVYNLALRLNHIEVCDTDNDSYPDLVVRSLFGNTREILFLDHQGKPVRVWNAFCNNKEDMKSGVPIESTPAGYQPLAKRFAKRVMKYLSDNIVK